MSHRRPGRRNGQPEATCLPATRPLALAVHFVLAAGTFALSGHPSPAHAQESTAAPSGRHYDIPAGSLSQTLTRFASETGIYLAGASDAATGRNSPGLKGRYTVQGGLAALLAGTGLEAFQQANGSYGLRPARSPAPAPEALLPAVVVTDERMGGSLMQPTRQVTVIEGQELDDLRATSPTLGAMLAKSVPGLSDASRTLSDFGTTLRGRNVLVLVDGIPLNTNRDSSRNLVNIEPSRIERVEVLRGSNAIYGSGATGGIISVTTRPVGGEPVARTTIGLDASLSRLRSEGVGGQVQHYLSGRGETIDYEVDVAMRRQAGAYDAHGDRIAPDASQGDLSDSNTYSLGGKLGIRIDGNQRIQLAASYLRAHQKTDHASDPGVNRAPLGSVNARAVKGLRLAEQNQVENALLSASYEHKNLGGSSLSAMLYGRDSYLRFPPADLRSNSNRGNNIDQAMQNNKVFGGRLTVNTPLGAGEDTRLTWGADYLQERSDMPVDVFDPAVYDASGGRVFRFVRQLSYMPWTTTRSAGAFAQLQHKFDERWSVEGGLRYERAQAGFDDFQPLSQSRARNPATVRGGKVSYDALLYNAGVSFKPVKDHELYASASQGFDLPDVGLQVRNAGAAFDIHSSELEPVKTDNYEIGWRGAFGDTLATLALFHSRSDLGAVQSFNNGLRLLRTRERINGLEATIDHYGEQWSSGGTLTWMQGRETPQDAVRDQPMTGYRIPPLKITGYVQYQPSERWSIRAQLSWFGAKDYRLADGKTQFARADVKSYYSVDIVGRYRFDKKNVLTIGVQNLFNRNYLPLYSQLMRSGRNDSRLPAAGAVLTASFTHQW